MKDHNLVMNPLVSVSLITYNHEKYISQALDSVLKQKTDFSFEILVGDDFSSDDTRKIIQEYQDMHPDKISLILHPKRYDEIPGRTNNMTNLYNCRGKYIAMLDGDDYWTDEHKLQQQVDFLERNEDFALTFHDVTRIGDNLKRPYAFSEKYPRLKKEQQIFTHENLLSEWFIPTSSVVFRNFINTELPEWFLNVYSADYALLLLATKKGKIFYHTNLMSVWREHDNSFSKTHHQSISGKKIFLNDREILSKAFSKMSWGKNMMLKIQYAHYRELTKLNLKNNLLKAGFYFFLSACIYPFVKYKVFFKNE